MSETTLWTNSSPTSTSGFAAQTVTLSSSISNFDYIGIYYKLSTDSTYTPECAIFKKSDFTTFNATNTNNKYYGGLGGRLTTNRIRRIGYVSNTQVQFTAAENTNNTGSVATALIPTKIVGIK